MSKNKIDMVKVRELYFRLIKINEILGADRNNPRDNVAKNYTNIVDSLERLIGEPLDDFKIPHSGYFSYSNGAIFYTHAIIQPKAIELSGLLEGKFQNLVGQSLSNDEKIYRAIKNIVINNKIITGVAVALIAGFLIWIFGWNK